jgi:hypothetical protein
MTVFSSQPSSTAIARDSLNSISAGLGSSLHRIGSDPTENTVSKTFLYCYRHVFTSPLHRNGRSAIMCVFISAGTCLPSRCPAINIYSDSAIPAFRRHIIILKWILVDMCFDSFDSRNVTTVGFREHMINLQVS